MNRRPTVKLLVASVLAAFAMSGCATNYDKYLAQVSELNKQQAETAQLRLAAVRSDNDAIARLAEGGSDAVKVAAAMSIAMQNVVAASGGGGNHGQTAIIPAPPKDPMESFLQVVGVVVPSAVQAVGIYKNAAVAMRQSDNATTVAVATNQAFEHIATGGFTALASVNPQPNITMNAGGDAVNGTGNSTTHRNCNGGSATGTGTGGNAAPGGVGGAGSVSTTGTGAPGGTGGASGAAGNGNPNIVAGNASC